MTQNFHDPYREYPVRLLGYANAIVRPWKDQISRTVYQSSIGIMHLYFLTNSYDYASRVDSTSRISSFLDCYTWHCCASWIGPAMFIDGVSKIMKRMSFSRPVGLALVYVAFPIAAVSMDYLANRYFYGVLSAGNREKPRLKL